LVRQVENYATKDPRIGFLAAGGFRDITRIASSSPAMWSDIVKHNRLNILALIDTCVGEMKTVKQLVASGDYDALYDYYSGAEECRDSLPVGARGSIDALYELYGDNLDRPGVISEVTTILAEELIIITNFRIIEAREDVFCVL